MFPRLSYLYRLLAVCVFVGFIVLFFSYHDYRITSMRMPLLQGYSNDVEKSINELLNTSTTGTRYNAMTSPRPILNPHNFNYVVNPRQLCSNKDITYIIYVHSAPRNYKKRQTIRQTWGTKNVLQMYRMRIVFVMGIVEDAETMDRVMLEYNRYGDIMIEDFTDTYRNLTYKAIAGLKWVSQYCYSATFVIKSDDDIFIDIHSLMNIMNSTEVSNYGNNNVILCNQWLRMKVIRDKKSKWYISEEEFPEEFFPPYCSGSIFIMSIDIVTKLYAASLYTKFFWVDDFYVTGLLVRKLNVEHRRLNDHYMLNALAAMDKFKNDKEQILKFYHVQKMTDIYKMWSALKERKNDTCSDCVTVHPTKAV